MPKKKQKAKKKKKPQVRNKGKLQYNSVDITEKEIEGKLEEYYTSIGPGPDYFSFTGWLFSKLHLDENKGIQPFYKQGYQPEVAGYFEAFYMLLNKYEKKLSTEHSWENRNKYKLLRSFYEGLSERGKQNYLLYQNEEKYSLDLDEELDELTPVELRFLFFKAMHEKKQSKAFKLFGKLKESDHDEGELNYLEALSSFQFNEFDEVIRYATKVQPDHIDFGMAQGLILESYALLGDAIALKEKIESVGKSQLSGYFFLYLLQVVLMNSDTFEETKEIVKTLIQKQANSLTDDLAFAPNLNRNTCMLAIEYVERKQERELQIRAFEQQKDDKIVDAISEADLLDTRDFKLINALALHTILYEKLIQAKEPAPVIIDQLWNVNYKLQEDDFITGFMTLYRLNKRADFVHNVVKNMAVIREFQDGRKWELIELAYVEAVVQNHPQVKALENILTKHTDLHNRRKILQEKAKDHQWLAFLSPMGLLAYESSEEMFEKCKEEGFRWKDAGMLSLGFFRLLEVEFNEKLIKPLAKSINFDAFEREVQKLKQVEKQKQLDFWENIYKYLTLIDQGKVSGLDLGALNHFFGKVKNKIGPDSAIKTMFFEEFSKILSEEGLRSLKSGEIAALFNADHRNRFRNPPAHTKFVTLQVAERCKKYVKEGLNSLEKWCK